MNTIMARVHERITVWNLVQAPDIVLILLLSECYSSHYPEFEATKTCKEVILGVLEAFTKLLAIVLATISNDL